MGVAAAEREGAGLRVVLWFYAPPGFPEEDMDGMKAALKEAALDRSFEIAARAAWILEQEKGM